MKDVAALRDKSANPDVKAVAPTLQAQSVTGAYQDGGKHDIYGRDLWDVWLPDGRFLQAVLVRKGAADAVAYRPQVAHAALLARLDAVATAAGRHPRPFDAQRRRSTRPLVPES